jgi:alpha-1,6-mannosyltransferase
VCQCPESGGGNGPVSPQPIIFFMTSLVLSLLLAAAGVLSLHVLPYHPIISYAAAFMSSSVFFLIAAYQLFRKDLPNSYVYVAIGIAILVRFSFLWTSPIGSDDLYRYVWDGKVQAHAINPYAYAPNSAELKHLSTATISSLVNHPEMKSIYFPLSEWIFYLSYVVSGEQTWGIKGLLLLSELCALYGLFLLMRTLDIPRRFMLLYAFCPMLFFEYAIDAHVDGFGLPLLIFALYFYFDKKKLLSMILLGLSLSIKPTALVLLPVFFFAEKDWRARLTIAFIPLLTLAVQFAPYVVSANPFESLSTFTKNWTFNGFVFNVIDMYVHDNQQTRLMCSIFLAIIILILSLLKRPLFDKLYYAVLFLLLFSPVVHPWYVGWLAALLPIARRWSGLVYVSTLSLTCFTYISFQLQGVWKEEPLVWLLEYLPVIVLLILELAQVRRLQPESQDRDLLKAPAHF